MKTFLLCPGTQRSGTTWLYKNLLLNKNVNFGDVKEYHYFDSLNIDCFFKYKKINQKHDTLSTFYNDKNMYFEYFINILNKYDLTGDISPGYSSLNDDIFINIKNMFNSFNIITKTIYLIRNPIERHISSLNVGLKQNYLKLNDDDYNKLLIEKIKDPEFIIHSDYINSHNKLLNIFKENYMIIKYEDLFNQKTFTDICNFLNIKVFEPNFNNKVNISDYNNFIYDETIDILNNVYKDQFDFYKSISSLRNNPY